MRITEKDKEYMREAIRLADESVKNGGGPFGAVIVKDRRNRGGQRQQRDLRQRPHRPCR